MNNKELSFKESIQFLLTFSLIIALTLVTMYLVNHRTIVDTYVEQFLFAPMSWMTKLRDVIY